MADLEDPLRGKMRIQLVNITSEHYKVARGYKIWLGARDLRSQEALAGLAKTAGVSAEVIKSTFAPYVAAAVAR